jgi:hypothetical protein
MSCQYNRGVKRNEVIQFRVTTEEKADLQRRAHPYDMSRLIREALGLSVGLKATVSPEILNEGGMKNVEITEQGTVQKADLDVLITQLKGQGMTTPIARREAKKRLGL